MESRTYKIIGGDQKEFGPIAADQLRHWISEGRANEQTLAQLAGSGQWKPLSSFLEFAETLTSKRAAAAGPPPSLDSLQANALAEEILARDYRVDIGGCFSRAWRLLKIHFWTIVVATAVMLAASILMAAVPIVGHVADLFFGFLLWGGLDWMILKLVRGQPASLEDALAGFKQAFIPLLVGSVIAHVLTFLGLLFLIIPGIYLLVSWFIFAPLLMIDKRLDFWPALELSRKVVTRHWFQVFLLHLVSLGVALAGLLALVAGVLVTLPIAIVASVYAYEDIFGGVSAKTPAEPLTRE